MERSIIMANNVGRQNAGKSLHDLANSLMVVRTALYNIQDILPPLLEAYQVALEYKPEACVKIQDEHLALLSSSVTEAVRESTKLKADFEQLRIHLS